MIALERNRDLDLYFNVTDRIHKQSNNAYLLPDENDCCLNCGALLYDFICSYCTTKYRVAIVSVEEYRELMKHAVVSYNADSEGSMRHFQVFGWKLIVRPDCEK
jgi:hypothetical protein